MNNTAKAIDMIPRSVVICDWHYEKAIPTPAYFALKGFDVIACPWRKPDVAEEQVKMMLDFRRNSTPEMKDNFLGLMQTSWTSAGGFMNNYYNPEQDSNEKGSEVKTFKAMVGAIKELEGE